MSPKIIPIRIKPMPPRRRSRRAPSGANVSLRSKSMSDSGALASGEELIDSIGPAVAERFRVCSCARLRRSGASSEGRHHALSKEVLCLDGFPVFESAKIGDDGQFADSTFGLQISNLADHLRRRANEANLLVHNLFVGQLGQRFERSDGLEPVTLAPQFRPLL